MLGSAGERVDFGAHLFGLLAGGVLGGLVAFALSLPPGALVQWAFAAASIAAILISWTLALAG
jgi:hypothetical protein